MKRFPSHYLVGVICGLFPFSSSGTTATALGSFEGIEEPLVRYAPATGTFKHDDFPNITDLGGGVFRMMLRYRSDEWDADRDTPNKDRQRAEVKGLGVHQKTGETFEYATTWRTSASFLGAERFCHIFQLKSTDGDSGAPLITVSILPGRQRAAVHYWSGTAKSSTAAREFSWKPGVWQTIRVRIKTSRSNDGEVLASVDGDEFQGIKGVALFRPDATDYRPKWGLYRGVTTGMPLGDDYLEHKNVSAGKIGAAVSQGELELETAARRMARESPAKALSWLQSQPLSPARVEAMVTIASEWAERDPSAAMSFAATLTPAEGRADSMQHVFNRWSDQNADAALRWVAGRALAAELDPLLWYFATDTTFRYVAREKALDAAVLISDSELRARAMDHVVLIWARRDPAAAADFVEKCVALTAAQKFAIRQKIDAASKH